MAWIRRLCFPRDTHCLFRTSTVYPDQLQRIDSMMIEYEGREDVLIGHLSGLLAAGEAPSVSDDDDDYYDDDDEEEQGREGGNVSMTDNTLGTGETEEQDQTSDALSTSSDRSEGEQQSAAASSPSSGAGSSEWSSEDELPSIDVSFKTNDTDDRDCTIATGLDRLVPIGAAAVSPPPGSTRPVLDLASAGASSDDEPATLTGMTVATALDLDAASEAGNWTAVGATVALTATSTPTRGSPKLSPSASMHSNISMSSNEEHQVHKLEQLVEAGNWEAVMAHANRIDDASTDQSMSENSTRSAESVQQPLLVSSPGSSGRDIREIGDVSDVVAEIAELVEMVVPDELGTCCSYYPAMLAFLVCNSVLTLLGF